jgi:hypothetical protein
MPSSPCDLAAHARQLSAGVICGIHEWRLQHPQTAVALTFSPVMAMPSIPSPTSTVSLSSCTGIYEMACTPMKHDTGDVSSESNWRWRMRRRGPPHL